MLYIAIKKKTNKHIFVFIVYNTFPSPHEQPAMPWKIVRFGDLGKSME